ncbi:MULTISPECIES: hypothetical protein [Tenacibaculum]|uniref:Uncharacterized protein n=1 Tax=Tenacibaculum aiptasiae TaxID=426481 RepID=A0A7J5ACX6_9FLAO|nr:MULTISPECIES: hypothetical protein [Tenacibaculum]KAB1155318.1 hypothetical protein F7018_12655 [Tenacibaculum aiptasiae]MCF2873409.1 hypothetical protein [Tenacibaculum sp. Cn5-1]MCF2933565.1 hypothetical protein [Tenacibaculum sp. Cn5-34]MCG7509853.1 hypothetical protein [Tenacibaculum sp. Cn5-46]
MENVFRYYEFSEFITDNSGAFSGNEICFSILNEQHFLIFEKNNEAYNLYVSKYDSKKDIGVKPPEILESLIKNYDKSVPEHRVVLRKYLY